ncbi:hypothetical protein [Streptomyces naganishii]|uniref:Uncharacterized protein n=1 Tax=Streptomyces naganishii JCM 4654 TaxID=1306179 RepID=A0A918Y7Q5_9ACTN|nr:hypothetical protein [Streptomyces naganishii]GHD92769.1 hypothetical protein GCM10010508_46910 [Streptomyces naganishii JCM 4654]
MVLFDIDPERAGQGAGELAEAAEVHARAPLVEVTNQHVPDRRGLDPVLGDQFLGRELAQPDGGAQTLVCVENADVAQQVPGSVQTALVPVIAADVPGTEFHHLVRGDLVEFLARVEHDLGQGGEDFRDLASGHCPGRGRLLLRG